ncbi:hypothetical protein BJ508DRAFT_149271 [Ascobolus immersus RN42]|uniref:Uncharacterized protein n=1 Tax=Ascobolus immersus RN42 TaxID=1160509 RepID=A0A3N4IKE3_ASCIM|nr:hypothetical protein BJ508DRAFT_149271 [Ascobolus immersus RN42]
MPHRFAKVFPCRHDGCGKLFSLSHRSRHEMYVPHNGQPALLVWYRPKVFPCRLGCGATFRLDWPRCEHELTSQVHSLRTFICEFESCGHMAFYVRHGLAKHVKYFDHENIRPSRVYQRKGQPGRNKVMCSVVGCGIYVQGKRRLEEHTELVHGPNSKRPFVPRTEKTHPFLCDKQDWEGKPCMHRTKTRWQLASHRV